MIIKQFYKLSFKNIKLFEDLWLLAEKNQIKTSEKYLIIQSNVFAGFVASLVQQTFKNQNDFHIVYQHLLTQKLNEYVMKYPITMLINN